jgi:hypothetical protein
MELSPRMWCLVCRWDVSEEPVAFFFTLKESLFCTEDRCIRYLRNICDSLVEYTAPYPIRQQFSIANSMEQSISWEAKIPFDSREIPCPFWDPNVHHPVHKSRKWSYPEVDEYSKYPPILLYSIHFNIILSSPAVLYGYSTVFCSDVLINQKLLSSVGIATGWMALVRFPAVKKFFSSPQRPVGLWSPPNLLSNEYRGYSGRGVKLTTQLHLVPRSRKVELCLHSPHMSAWHSA